MSTPSIATFPPTEPLTACDSAPIENRFMGLLVIACSPEARSSIFSPRERGIEGLRSRSASGMAVGVAVRVVVVVVADMAFSSTLE